MAKRGELKVQLSCPQQLISHPNPPQVPHSATHVSGGGNGGEDGAGEGDGEATQSQPTPGQLWRHWEYHWLLRWHVWVPQQEPPLWQLPWRGMHWAGGEAEGGGEAEDGGEAEGGGEAESGGEAVGGSEGEGDGEVEGGGEAEGGDGVEGGGDADGW